MEPRVHLRSPVTGERTFALCGMGAPWPSGIALRDTVEEVTCKFCLRKHNKSITNP